MADTYHMVADFSFTDQSEIPVQHDVGGPVSVQVVIGAQTRPPEESTASSNNMDVGR